MTIVEFLWARLDEDEQVARRATAGRWAWIDPGGRHKIALVAVIATDWQMVVPSGSGDVYPSRWDADHIARHDPARVLREVEAKRRIVELHSETELQNDEGENVGAGCADCAHFDWPCETLRLLALSYADHPGYDESWRP